MLAISRLCVSSALTLLVSNTYAQPATYSKTRILTDNECREPLDKVDYEFRLLWKNEPNILEIDQRRCDDECAEAFNARVRQYNTAKNALKAQKDAAERYYQQCKDVSSARRTSRLARLDTDGWPDAVRQIPVSDRLDEEAKALKRYEQQEQERVEIEQAKAMPITKLLKIPEDQQTLGQQTVINEYHEAQLKADKESPRAIRYAYSAKICGALTVIAGGEKRIKDLSRRVKVGTFEGKSVFAGGPDEKRAGIEYIRSELLQPHIERVKEYRNKLSEKRLTQIPCAAPEIRMTYLCVRGATIPMCRQSPMPAVVELIEEANQQEHSGG